MLFPTLLHYSSKNSRKVNPEMIFYAILFNNYSVLHEINCKPRAVPELVQAMPRRSVIVNEV